ncbi:TrmH family RNA methyltransferase [Nonomuraea muscovyensis]|uniref:TrmH family RNA methyltransferase n=1 Tax=Nonomuraea muscovyensis TaxID=1124761 RepID=UPI0035E44D3D
MCRCAGGGWIILSPRCADPLYRRAVKVSMGAVFSIPYARMDYWFTGLEEIRKAGYQMLALTPDQTVTPMDTVKLSDRGAGAVGAVVAGLSGWCVGLVVGLLADPPHRLVCDV